MMLLSDLPRASSSPYDALPLGGKASSRLIEEGSRKSAVRQLSAAKKTHHSTTMITASASSSASSVDSTQSVSTQMRSLPPTHIESQVFEVKASPLGAGSPPQQNTRGQHEIASPSSNKPRPEAATSPISSDRPAAAPNIDAAQSTVGAAGGANMTSAVNSDTASTGAAGLSGIRALLKRFSRGMGIGKPANNKPTDSKPKDGRSNSPRASDTNSKAAKAVTGAKGKPS
ncbi:uncharacterized protein BJ171DRAFT_517140 [Polychytrium aggregatum]|uniref:uncharacterized protein n=1 Tax=Polychytrium aggregatum TaxID=110093 RepID=UPI0022FF1F48|nr:uncharacterized protein BJ171DRAFT_517140 [Polychytrium aggregatum]KAI9199820.1 hypothetical protein BJ171DRAFT_517140 [Polychytrium aggregatum]